VSNGVYEYSNLEKKSTVLVGAIAVYTYAMWHWDDMQPTVTITLILVHMQNYLDQVETIFP